MLISGVVSPISLGPLVDSVGYVVVLLSIASMSAVNLIYTFFFLRDNNESDAEPSENSNSRDLVDPSCSVARSATLSSIPVRHQLTSSIVLGTPVMDEPNLQGSVSTSINSSALVRLSINSNTWDHDNEYHQSPADFDMRGVLDPDLCDDENLTDSNQLLLPAVVPTVETCRADLSKKAFIQSLFSHLKSSTRLFTHRPQVSFAGGGGIIEVRAMNRRLKLNILLLAFFITNLPTFDFSLATLFEVRNNCWILFILRE